MIYLSLFEMMLLPIYIYVIEYEIKYVQYYYVHIIRKKMKTSIIYLKMLFEQNN